MDATIRSAFWTDERLEEQPPEIKLVCLWIITNPSRDICGFTRVSPKRFTFETGLPASSLQAACKALPSSFQELSGRAVFATNFLRHQFGRGGKLSLKNKVVIAACRHAKGLPSPLQEAFFAAYPEIEEDPPEHPQNPSLPHPPPKGDAPIPDGVIAKHSIAKHSSSISSYTEADIAQTVALYPRNEGRTQAKLHLAHHLRSDSTLTLDAVQAGTSAIAAVISTLPDGGNNGKLPSAARFFEARRWEDDPATWRRPQNRSGSSPAPLHTGGRRPAEVINLSLE